MSIHWTQKVEFLPANRMMLSEYEMEILELHYMQGHSVSEIAASMHVSRQAINQAKLKALKKMRQATKKGWSDKITTAKLS